MLVARHIYYSLKPFIPRAVRLALRRWHARKIRATAGAVWPILEAAGRTPKGWPGWPQGKQFALVLTHDVEGRRGLARCRKLVELEARLGFRSAVYFVPEGEYHAPADLREDLTTNGFEVGVHDLKHDGKLYRSRRGFRDRARRINRYIREWNARGFRSGLMHHNLDWLRDLDVLYDASTFDTDPFEPQPDGVQTTFPFWVAGLDGGGYVELPYTLAQDSTLFVILQERSTEIWKQKLKWIASCGGMAMLNVHPDYMSFAGACPSLDEYPVALYEDFLTWIKQEYDGQYWHALPKDVAAFYLQTVTPEPQHAPAESHHADG